MQENKKIQAIKTRKTHRTPRDYLQSIENKLKDIESNTGTDHTESWGIKSGLDDISRNLEQIMKKL